METRSSAFSKEVVTVAENGDYLITHPDERARYGHLLERDLARRFATDRDGYADAKGRFVSETPVRARHSD